MTLRRYWFRFAEPGHGLGYGVTAHGYEDALSLLRDTVFGGEALPPFDEVVEDVDVRALDQRHVIPNMEPPVWRGVWFPKGYAVWK
jgi:hypothetical protein